MLFCTNITKSFGPHKLFSEASFQLNRKERVGIIGRNGCGKSTLFRLILGEDNPDDGQITYPEHYRIGKLEQHLKFSRDSVLEEVAQILPPNEEHNRWKAEKILYGLGFNKENFRENPAKFSGGFQIRIKLAQLLLSEPDLLLLDEPTNYLDILAIRWLESFLKKWSGEVLCISHDHEFLARAMTHNMIIHRQKFKKIRGNPAKIYEQIALEEDIHEKTRLKQLKELKKQEKFIREFRAGARSAGLVQSRIKMLAKKERIQPLPKIKPIKFHFPEWNFNGAKVLEARNLSFGYQENEDLLKKVSLEVFPGEKVAIIGANGKGKTTLLKIFAGFLSPTAGVLKKNKALLQGYFGQSNIDNLDPQKTILEALHEDKSKTEQEIRNIAGSLLFTGDLAKKKVAVLSGGEKARVNLGKILLKRTNILLLDEPTNHLDYESVEALISAIQNYSGAVLAVSHNENFLQKIAKKLIVFDEDEVFVWNGSYQDFLAKKGFKSESDNSLSSGERAGVRVENPAKKLTYNEKKELQKSVRKLERELQKIEDKISELEKQQAENREKIHIASRQGNRLKLETLGIEAEQIQLKISREFEKWEELGVEVEVLRQRLAEVK